MSISPIASYDLPDPRSLPEGRVSWTLDPRRAALLVHDMQDYFLRPYGATEAPLAPVLRHVSALISAFHEAGSPVFFSAQPGEQSRDERGLLWDMWGAGIVAHPGLETLSASLPRRPGDVIVPKRRYSAFFETGLLGQLGERGCDQLVICGIYAHIGCLATAVDGFMRGIQPFMVADAVADFSRTDHDVALRQVARTCGVVTRTSEVVERLTRASARAPGAHP